MADYCTLEDVKYYIGTNKADHDLLLNGLIERASARIDRYCRRHFTATIETRKFDAVLDVAGRTLHVDDDLLTITTLTNGDGDTLSASDYVLLPTNVTPKYAIKLKASSGEAWTYTTDPEEAISVTGTWGFQAGTTPPSDITHAAIRLTAWYFHQKDGPFETTGLPEVGIVSVPADIPRDIKSLLDAYVRTRIGGGGHASRYD